MIRAANAHRLQPAGGTQRHTLPAGQDHGQRAGPEGFGQPQGAVGHGRRHQRQLAEVDPEQAELIRLAASLSARLLDGKEVTLP